MGVIWEFAYGERLGRFVIDDLNHFIKFRGKIPNVLLANSVPVKPFITGPNHQSIFFQTQIFSKLLEPNPYILGNPYFPSTMISDPFFIWSQGLHVVMSTISAKAIRKARTYPKVIRRKFRRMCMTGVSEWNSVLRDVFHKHDFWFHMESYGLRTHREHRLIEIFLQQLLQAQYA